MEDRIAGVFRLLLLAAVLIGTALVLAPLQWAAQRQRWRLSRLIPMAFCRALCWCFNVRPTFHGKLAEGPLLLVPNHVSWLDIPALGCSGPVAFVAKREVAGWPVFGALARLQGAIFLDRTRRRQVRETNLCMARRMREGQSVVLFAEGTTGCGSRLKRFYTSHFEAARNALDLDPAITRVHVQPVAIAYTRRSGMPLGRSERPMIAWYGDMTLLPHLWGMVTGGPIDCDIHFLEPIVVENASSRKAVGHGAERAVRHAAAMALTGRCFRPATARPDLRPVLILAERS